MGQGESPEKIREYLNSNNFNKIAIERAGIPCIFNKIPKPVIAEFLMSYFTLKEAKDLGNINILFRNSFYLKFELFTRDWTNRLNLLRDRYQLNIPDNERDLSELEAIKNKRMYQLVPYAHNFIQITGVNKIRFVGLYNKLIWAWVDDGRYYKTKQLNNSFKGKTRYMNSVCWVNSEMTLNDIPKANYTLTLRHGFPSLEKGELTMTVSIGENKLLTEDYPSYKMLSDYKNRGNMDMINTEVLKIEEKDFKDFKETIKISIWHKNTSWKSGWYIDSAYLDSY